MFEVVSWENYNTFQRPLTSTFLETTFFTTAAKRPDMSRPSAIIYNQKKGLYLLMLASTTVIHFQTIILFIQPRGNGQHFCHKKLHLQEVW